MGDIVTQSAKELAKAGELSQVERMFSQIMEAASNPAVDASKMTALVDLQLRMMDRQKEEEFNRDKVAAIIEMPAIRRDGRIVIPAKGNEPERVQGRFVKYESLQAVIDPILAKHNLILTHHIDSNGTMLTVQPILSHTNGYVEKGGAMPLPLDTSGGKNNTQGAGSSVSYGMRYTATAMLHIRIHGIDDDGTGAGDGSAEDRMTTDQKALVAAGRDHATQGSKVYGEWFAGLTAAQKGWLAYEPYHGQNKHAAELVDQH